MALFCYHSQSWYLPFYKLQAIVLLTLSAHSRELWTSLTCVCSSFLGSMVAPGQMNAKRYERFGETVQWQEQKPKYATWSERQNAPSSIGRSVNLRRDISAIEKTSKQYSRTRTLSPLIQPQPHRSLAECPCHPVPCMISLNGAVQALMEFLSK